MRFTNIPGHSKLKERLATNIDEGRVPHAQLFVGEDGSGVLPLAIAYGQYLFCENKQGQDSCGECRSCKNITAFNHPDLHFSFPFKLISKKNELAKTYISEWREQLSETLYFDLQDWNEKCAIGNSQPIIPEKEALEISTKLSLKSFEGGVKVLIVWHAELMNATAANKLLKLIEEPPDKTVIILTTNQQDRLLKTITSRTQLVQVKRIMDADLMEYLVGCEGLDSERAKSLVVESEGSYLKTRRQMISENHHQYYFNHFQTWMRLSYQKKVVETFNWAETISGIGREQQKQFLQYCLKMIRQCILGNYTDMEMVKLHGEEREFMNNFSKFVNNKNVMQLTKEFNDAHYHIERNANPKILFTDLSIKIIRLLRKQ